MVATSLATVWSLDTTFPEEDNGVRPAILNSTSSSELALWAVSTYSASRWGLHFLSILITRIPSTEARLRNEGFIPLYKNLCSMNAGIAEIAQQNQISLPSFPPPHPDYDQEASDTAKDTLGATAVPQVGLPIRPLMDTIGSLMRGDQGHHWGSLAAFVGVGGDAYLSAVSVTKEFKSTPGERTIAPFTQPATSENMVQACKVIREELVRCREEASRTGWKDDEARELAQEFVKYFEKLSSVGL